MYCDTQTCRTVTHNTHRQALITFFSVPLTHIYASQAGR